MRELLAGAVGIARHATSGRISAPFTQLIEKPLRFRIEAHHKRVDLQASVHTKESYGYLAVGNTTTIKNCIDDISV
jgi:hypothetical protein